MSVSDLTASITKRKRQIHQTEHVVRMQERLWCLSDAKLVASNAERLYPNPAMSIAHLEKNLQLCADPGFQSLAKLYHRLDNFPRFYLASRAREDLNYLATRLANRQIFEGFYDDIVAGIMNVQLVAADVVTLCEARRQEVVPRL